VVVTSARTASWLAWSLAGLSVVMFVASVVLYFLAHSSQVATSAGDTLSELLIFATFLAFPIVGVLIASRHPKNPVGWICLAVGLFWMLIFLGDSIPGSGPYLVTIDALTQAMWIPPVGLLGIYLILLFPDGKFPSRRWRPLAWLSGVVMVLYSLGITFALMVRSVGGSFIIHTSKARLRRHVAGAPVMHGDIVTGGSHLLSSFAADKSGTPRWYATLPKALPEKEECGLRPCEDRDPMTTCELRVSIAYRRHRLRGKRYRRPSLLLRARSTPASTPARQRSHSCST
jgi:hypothetical protein